MDFEKQVERHARNVRGAGAPAFTTIGLLAFVLAATGNAAAWLFVLLLVSAVALAFTAPYLYGRFVRLSCPECGNGRLKMKALSNGSTAYRCSSCPFSHRTKGFSERGHGPNELEAMEGLADISGELFFLDDWKL